MEQAAEILANLAILLGTISLSYTLPWALCETKIRNLNK